MFWIFLFLFVVSSILFGISIYSYKKQENKDMRIVISLIFFSFLFFIFIIVSIWDWGKWYITLPLAFCIIVAFFINAIQKIKADPPHKGILLFLGKRQKIILNEGWRYFPFCPLIFDFIQVNVVKRNVEFTHTIMTKDDVSLAIQGSLTYSPVDLKVFLTSGEDKNVWNILEGVVLHRIREWARSETEGPADWRECVGMRFDAVAVILKTVAGEVLEKIPHLRTVPTPTLIRFFDDLKPSKIEETLWKGSDGEEWGKLKEKYNKLSPSQKDELKEAIRERRSLILRVLSGNGHFTHPNLGVVIHKLVVPDVKPLGLVSEDAEKQELERMQTEYQQIESENYRKMVDMYMTRGLSASEAMQAALIITGKIKDPKYTKFDVPVGEAVTALLKALGKE